MGMHARGHDITHHGVSVPPFAAAVATWVADLVAFPFTAPVLMSDPAVLPRAVLPRRERPVMSSDCV